MARPTLYVRRAATVATAMPVLMAEAFDFDLVRGAPAGKFELTGASRSISRTITDPWRLSDGLPPPGKGRSTWGSGNSMNRLLLRVSLFRGCAGLQNYGSSWVNSC